MNQNLENTSKDLLKTELATVYVTTSNKKFLNHSEAVQQEMATQEKNQIKRNKEAMIMEIHELISKVLSKNDWGVFFKAEPLQDCPVQEGAKMYKVNEVSVDRLYDALKQTLNETENTWKQNTKEEQTDSEQSIG